VRALNRAKLHGTAHAVKTGRLVDLDEILSQIRATSQESGASTTHSTLAAAIAAGKYSPPPTAETTTQ
jgi:hypothetical protein